MVISRLTLLENVMDTKQDWVAQRDELLKWVGKVEGHIDDRVTNSQFHDIQRGEDGITVTVVLPIPEQLIDPKWNNEDAAREELVRRYRSQQIELKYLGEAKFTLRCAAPAATEKLRTDAPEQIS
jgi:hypothetical protein